MIDRPVYYVDSSVVGGSFDREFREPTRTFWQQAKAKRFAVLLSALVGKELAGAPEIVKRFYQTEVRQTASVVDITEEMVELANAYVAAGAVPSTYRDDAIHVAAATVSRAWAVVSWNFKHLVNIRRENIFNSVNILHGYRAIRIISPMEVIEDEG